VRSWASQAGQLVAWTAAWPDRTWAVEGVGGLGYLLAQQLVAGGERVLDVQPKPGARVRLLVTGNANKNDPKRHRDLGRTRTRVACRLHAVLCELVPGGISKKITAAQATKVLEQTGPSGAAAVARCELAAEFLDDLRRIDAQMLAAKKRLAVAVKASGTTTAEVFGVGPSSAPR
jgi:transposase